MARDDGVKYHNIARVGTGAPSASPQRDELSHFAPVDFYRRVAHSLRLIELNSAFPQSCSPYLLISTAHQTKSIDNCDMNRAGKGVIKMEIAGHE